MSEKSINLCMGIHNHQPVGNFDHILKESCERCYLPFLQVLARHPKVKISVHFTGYLLDWIVKNYSEIITLLKQLVDAGQVELVTGGFYEPVLAIIPDHDKLGQIKKLTDYLHKTFEHDGRKISVDGMWLAERVWEPHLPKTLVQAGVKYVALDDSHFKAVGFDDNQLFRSYVTEEVGHSLQVFPINQQLRYLIPFSQPEKIIEYLQSVASEDGDAGAFYFDDGEKFGVWPGTFESVYQEGWLERFFELLEQNASWIKLKTFAEYAGEIGPVGRVYLATASYSEMMEWSLPPGRAQVLDEAMHTVEEKYRLFLRGGFWRNFLVKYPEANNLQKKMLHVSNRLNKLEEKVADKQNPDLIEAKDKLWMSQSNDPFWHGVFGGLYLTNLRTANYQSVIAAEALLDKVEAGLVENTDKNLPVRQDCLNRIERLDFDCDGAEEILVSTDKCNFYIAPVYGGSLLEFDYKLRPFNLTDTLSRRPEPYHSKLKQAVLVGGADNKAESIHGQVKAKEEDLDKYLVYDWYRRMSFMDHFLGDKTTLEQVAKAKFAEQGDFVAQPYKVVSVSNGADKMVVSLERQGHVWVGEFRKPITVMKSFEIEKISSSLKVTYTLTNTSADNVHLRFAPELNFNFLAPDAPDRFFFDAKSGQKLVEPLLNSQGALEQTTGIGIADGWLGLRLHVTTSIVSEIWRHPVFTVSNSEAGFERIYQGSAIIFTWPINLEPGKSWTSSIELKIGVQ